MFCNQCGHRNPSGSNFCSTCGSPLEGPEAEDPTITFAPVEAAGEVADEELTISMEGVPSGTGVLVVKRGDTVGTRFVLDKETTTAGRATDSDIFLDDITVSRRHVEITRDGHGYRVTDVGSLNGTYVNRERIEQASLKNGDEIQIGKFKLVFLGGETTGERPSSI